MITSAATYAIAALKVAATIAIVGATGAGILYSIQSKAGNNSSSEA